MMSLEPYISINFACNFMLTRSVTFVFHGGGRFWDIVERVRKAVPKF